MKSDNALVAMLKGSLLAFAVCMILLVPIQNNTIIKQRNEISNLQTELKKSTILIDVQLKKDNEAVDVDAKEQVKALQKELIEKNDIIKQMTAREEAETYQSGGKN